MTDDFPKDEQQARIDRDATRQELTETLDALMRKLDVKQRATQRVDEVVERTTAKVADKVSEPAAEKFHRGVEIVRNNPLPVIAAIVTFLLVIRLTRRR